MLRVIALLGAALLAGCTPQLMAADAAVDQAIHAVEQVNDRRAEVYVKVPCAMPAGGFESLEDFNVQVAVGGLCFPKFLRAYRAYVLEGHPRQVGE